MNFERSFSPVYGPDGNRQMPLRSVLLRAHLNLLMTTKSNYEASYGCICRDLVCDISQNRTNPSNRTADNISELLSRKWRIKDLIESLDSDIMLLEGILDNALDQEALARATANAAGSAQD